MYIFPSRRSLLRLCLLSALAIEGAVATLSFTNPSLSDLTAGAPFNITWSGASGTTTLTLQNGTASNINTVGVISTDMKNPYVVWSPYATVPPATYVLRLDDTSGQSAYSPQFTMLPSGTKTSLTKGLQFTNPTMQGITAGAPFNITWAGASGGTTLTLQNGTSNSINTVDVISSDITNPFIVWSPYPTTPAGRYVLRLDDASGAIAYSTLFDMIVPTSGPAVVTTTVSSPSSSSTSTSSSSSAVTQSSAATSQISSPTSASSQASPSSSLSTGAKAGIAVGAVILALGLIFGAMLFFLNRIHRSRESSTGNSASETSQTAPFGTSYHETNTRREKSGVDVDSRMLPVEVSGVAVHELGT